MEPWVTGPISNFDSVVLSAVIESEVYYLVTSPNSGYVLTKDWVTQDQVTPVSGYSLISFMVQITEYPEVGSRSSSGYTSLTLKDNSTGNYAIVDENNRLVRAPTLTQKTVLQAVETQAQQWRPSTALLSSVNYSLQTDTGATLIALLAEDGTTSELREANNIYFVPVKTYTGGTCAQINDLNTTLVRNTCSLSGSTQGTCLYIPPSWTTSSECSFGLFYDYCSLGSYCGTNCKAPCQVATQSCNWNTNVQAFQCSTNLAAIGSSSWWSSWWFIAIVAIILLSLIITLTVSHFLSKNRPQEISSQEIDPKLGPEKVIELT